MAIEMNRVDASAVLREGRFFILDDYALRDEMYAKVKDTFLEGIETIEDRSCRDRISAAGLSKMHEHFPVEKVPLLEDFLSKRLRKDLYYWSSKVGREDLGLDHPFFVDHLIVMRIHYPFLIARQAKNVQEPSYPLAEKLRLGMAALKNWRMLINGIRKAREPKMKTAFDPEAYHKKLPTPARAHGPHVDTWYGHSYDGINLWWSIDGVNEDNTIILYPELFGVPLAYDPVSMYLAPGVPVTKPNKLLLGPGQLLVFNPEMLHGTQVNISNETRIVISPRLNPNTPCFDANAGWHFEHWYSSKDLERKKFSKVSVFPADKFQGTPSFPIQSEHPVKKTVTVQYSERLTRTKPLPVCAATELGDGEKIAVDLENAKVLLLRDGATLRAFGRICPHLGMDLADGYHDEKQIYCPGHGVAFSLADGSSRCQAFKLRQYSAFEQDGQIYLQYADNEDGENSTTQNE